MPHTTTKNLRLKRPDTRPNEKQRRKLKRKVDDSQIIQDLRVTCKQKGEKKQRIAPITELSMLSKGEKALRAMKKKLKNINDLIDKQASGIELDEQQLAKVSTLDAVLNDIDRLIDSDSKST